MVSEAKEEQNILAEIKASIIQDKKQTSVRIPSELVSKFSINSKEDSFKWLVIGDKDAISLVGSLVKGKNAEKNI